MRTGTPNKRRWLTLLMTLLGVLAFFSFAGDTDAASGINQQINFQGRLLNSSGATVPDGYYNIEFKIYQDGDGQSVGNSTGSPAGSLKWTEDHLNDNSQGVQVKNGYFSVALGSITAFGSSIDWNQDTLWLSLNIGSTGASCTPFSSCSPDGEMTPMKRLAASPYALNSGLLDGLDSSQFVQLAQGLQTDATTNTSININKTGGSGNFLGLQASGTDVFTLTNSGDITFGANANHTLSVAASGAGAAGKSLTLAAGAAGTGASALAGGNLVLQGGAGGGTNGNGGNIVIDGGVANGSGTDGTISIGTNHAGSISIGKSGVATTVNGALTSSGTLTASSNVAVAGDVSYDANAGHTLSVSTAGASTAGYSLTISGGAAGTGASALTGGGLTLQGGAGGGTNGNGGDVTINGGAGTGTGVSGLVNLGASAFTAATDSACSSNCTVTQAYVDNYGSVVVSATTGGIIITLPAPTNTSAVGRILYITADTASSDFTLEANSGGSLVDVAMRHDSTATMVWNGSAWTAAGASNATTLQATYNNGANPSTTPEIKLDSTHGTIDIQDADTSIGQDLFNIRASNAGNLGTVLFGVSDTGTVTIRNNSDQQAAFRFQNATGSYLLNVNTANNYFINNGIKSDNNLLSNPGFESGADVAGDTTLGEQGWFGGAQGVIANNSSNAHTGNYELQITPNGTNLDIYGGTYYAVQPGDTIYFEGWVKNSAGANGTGGIELTFYDKDKSNPTTSTDYGSLPGTTYILKSVKATVPAGKYYVRASAAVRSGATTGTYYFDDFTLRNSTSLAPLVLQNSVNSTSAFTIQSAGGSNTLFTADTTNNILKVGDNTGTNTDTTILVLDSATSNPTTLTNKNGGLFYNSTTGSLEAILGGAVYDVCTTASVCSGYGAGAGSAISLQASSPGTQQTGNFNISGTGILSQLQTQDVSAASTNSSNLTIRTGNASGTTSSSGNLILDVGTATGSLGSIQIGHAGVNTTMAGTLQIQSANALSLGNASSATGSVRLYNNVGSNYVSIAAAGANPTSSWTLTLPQNPGSSGDCLKASSNSGDLAFGNCAAGVSVTLQDTYNYSSAPATITLADNKDLKIIAQDTSTDPSIVYDLQCTTCSSNGGRFAVQNGGTDVFAVKPNGGGVVMAADVQIGSATTNSSQRLLHLDSYQNANGTTMDDAGTSCSTTTNQGAMYYNTLSQSIRACQDGTWDDVVTTKDLGLFMFGVVPDSGGNPWDLPSKITTNVSGPCKVSWKTATSVNVSACVAYSGGRRVNVPTSTVTITGMNTSTTRYAHICLDSDGQPYQTTAGTSLTANMPVTNLSDLIAAPVLCLADVVGSTSTSNNIASLYDTRTFTTTQKTAVVASTAVENGMLIDVTANGAVQPSTAASQKLNGVVLATDGGTSSSTPNVIIGLAGPSNVKCTGTCTAGDFVKTSATAGYGTTTSSIPNNSFYFSVGNARNAFSNTCSSASNCNGSVYVDFIVR